MSSRGCKIMVEIHGWREPLRSAKEPCSTNALIDTAVHFGQLLNGLFLREER